MKSHRLAVLGLLLAIAAALAFLACEASKPAPHRVGLTPGVTAQTSAFSYQSGSDAGTVIVPPDTFVTSIWAVGGNDGGTIVITPSSQFTYPTCTSVEGGWVDGGCADGAVLDGDRKSTR